MLINKVSINEEAASFPAPYETEVMIVYCHISPIDLTENIQNVFYKRQNCCGAAFLGLLTSLSVPRFVQHQISCFCIH